MCCRYVDANLFIYLISKMVLWKNNQLKHCYKEMNIMSTPNNIDEKAKHIYESHMDEWEKLYLGRIIAIDIDENDLATVGDSVSTVGQVARTKRPGHRIFMRRVGKNPSVVRLRNHNHD